MDTDTERSKKLVDTFIQELFTHGDTDAVDRYLAPDLVHHAPPPFTDMPDGREGLRAMGTTIRAAAPDWHSDLELLLAEGDHVVERFTASGIHRGELFGVAPTGKTLVLSGINMYRVQDARIAEMWSQVDVIGLLRPLGLA
ncbi:ester cyclase [Actinomycetospora sp. NBRC 106375]|uniref:ester cyclase n=1 Tax=Actinomycetospora sp. NBRC 106375 TaxID=3032207 RepID=UPI002555E68A|nr:ester cyclase [Actinomycetospora sp. NBRC 106375]